MNAATYRPLIVVGVIAASFVALYLGSCSTANTGSSESAEVIPWRADWAAAKAESEKTGKPIFADFNATWCGPCQSLKHTLWNDKSVAAALEKFVPVQVDVDQNPKLAEVFAQDGIPALYVLDSNGNVKNHLLGAPDKNEFIDWLKSGS
jgi:thiol:disulfide interchange protein